MMPARPIVRGLGAVMHRGVSYGRVTGIKSYHTLASSAVLVDSVEVYERVEKTIEVVMGGRYTGYPGFRFVAGRYLDHPVIVGTIPPYPEAVVEVVSELYMMGVRNFVMLTRGYRLGKLPVESRSREEDSIFIAVAAVPLDGVSERVAAPGLPLMPSEALLKHFINAAKGEVEGIESGGSETPVIRGLETLKGVTVTLKSPRMPWSYQEVEPYLGMRGVRLADSVTAPLYALQYYYSRVRALSLIIALKNLTPAAKPVEYDYEQARRVQVKEAEIMSRALIAVVEALKRAEEAESGGPRE